MVRCTLCGGRTFGEGACIICKRPFTKLREAQITCGSKKCRGARQLQKQKIWKENNAHHFLASTRFKHEYVICKVCKDKVPKTRINQATCLSKKCQYKIKTGWKYRSIKSEHGYRNLGQVQLP